jgi:hypothetical protein
MCRKYDLVDPVNVRAVEMSFFGKAGWCIEKLVIE